MRNHPQILHQTIKQPTLLINEKGNQLVAFFIEIVVDTGYKPRYTSIHRIDGPAVIRTDGSQEWYINDRHLTKQITIWMTDLDITYPFDEESQALFLLTFDGK
jgi:hypothetical protein